MKKLPEKLACTALLIVSLVAVSGTAAGATPYVVANDDSSFPFTGVSFFAVGPNGGLTRRGQVATPGTGIGGGFFGRTASSSLMAQVRPASLPLRRGLVTSWESISTLCR